MLLINRRWIGRVLSILALAACFAVAHAQVPDSKDNDGHDFDFSIGIWKTHIKRLQHPSGGAAVWTEWNGTVATRKIWDGGADLEELDAGDASTHIRGLTLRLYNAKTRRWSLYWADGEEGAAGAAIVGEFKQGRGVFYDHEIIDKRKVLVRDIYADMTANSYHFEEASSKDDGKTWETNFVADLTRVQQGLAQEDSASAHGGTAAQHDFDWQFGSWKMHMTRLAHPLSGAHSWAPMDASVVVEKVWNGLANLAVIDTQGPSGHLQFLSLRLYNPKTHQWSLNFTSLGSGTLGVPMLGEFKQGTGMFYSRDELNGKAILCRFIFSNPASAPANEEQAFSSDGGKTWEVNWINTSSIDTQGAGRAP